MSDTFDDRPLPFWLRALLRAHQSGIQLPVISHGGKPGLSRAETGMMLAGASRAEDATFRLRYLGQDNERQFVFARLLEWAEKQSETPSFASVHCPDCLSRLVSLVVDEDTISHHHHNEAFRARYMGISRYMWRKRYDEAHKHLRERLDRWAGGAVGCAYRNIYERPAEKAS